MIIQKFYFWKTVVPTDGAKLMMLFFGARERWFLYDVVEYEKEKDDSFVRGSILLIKRPTSTSMYEHVH